MGILTDDMKRVVREQVLGFVATVSPDGTPNVSPKGTLTVWDDDHLVFADLGSPRTMANLGKGAAVEVNVVDPVTRTGYRFKGRGEAHVDGPVFDEIVAWYERDRQLARSRVRGVARIEVEWAAPLVSPAYEIDAQDAIVDRSWRRIERVYGVRVTGNE